MANITDFDTNSIMVVLDSKISAVNFIHDYSFFKGVNVKSIKDLTARGRNTKSDKSRFKQILEIQLQNKNKDFVLAAVEALQNLEGVYSAQPKLGIHMFLFNNRDGESKKRCHYILTKWLFSQYHLFLVCF